MSLLNSYPQLCVLQTFARQKRKDVYLVGGFLRDYFLDRPQTDFDFASPRGSVAFARMFANHIKAAFVVLDLERGCARVIKKEGDQLLTFDFADFRAPTLKDDLKKRDFSINTFAVDIQAISDKKDWCKEILSTPSARTDLKAKRICRVGTGCFKDDPLRLMRAFSLQAQLGFRIEAKTLQAVKKECALIQNVSFERVRDELFKILISERTYDVLVTADKTGLLGQVMPQLRVMAGVKQGGYHHLDVWKHSLEAVNQLESVLKEAKQTPDLKDYLEEIVAGGHPRAALIKLAALLHDIGKPETRKVDGDRMTFHAHEHVGKSITRLVAKRLKLSVQERYILEDIVRWHLRPGYLANFKNPTERAIFRYFRDTKEEAISVLLLSLADQRATRGPLTSPAHIKHHEKICRKLIAQLIEKKKEKPFVRLISGNDLIRTLKLKPSPLFGKILLKVEEAQVLKKITTKKEAIELAGKIAQGHKNP